MSIMSILELPENAEIKDLGVSLMEEKLLITNNDASILATKLSQTSPNAWIGREESPVIDYF
jgi:hypothetical protein